MNLAKYPYTRTVTVWDGRKFQAADIEYTTLDRETLDILAKDFHTKPFCQLWDYDGRTIVGAIPALETAELTGAVRPTDDDGNPTPVNAAWCRSHLKRWAVRNFNI